MLDFVVIRDREGKKATEIYPEFIIKKSKDLMIRGKSFYAIWDEETGLWSKEEEDVQRIVDQMIYEYAEIHGGAEAFKLQLLQNFSSNKWTEWQKYCKSLPDHFHELDAKIIFSNTKIGKRDYITKRLPYPLEEGPIPYYEELINTLYDPSERQKIEWAIGAIIKGDSKFIQKFLVFYGEPGSGKSTMLNIIQDLFQGYYATFDSKALGSASGSFVLESFKNDPVLAIEHEGDLSRIEDNTRLNAIVSHDEMEINEKFKAKYPMRFHTFLMLGTNKPVKITDAKSGILRRLIDVNPSGRLVSGERYLELVDRIRFELSGIAFHCLSVYEKLGPRFYNGYVPLSMMGATNDFFNFIEDNLDLFDPEPKEGIALKTVWRRYREYCEEANISYPFNMRVFKSELKNYFREFKDRTHIGYSVYSGFRKERFSVYREKSESDEVVKEDIWEIPSWLHFEQRSRSEFDDIFKDCPAQYAVEADGNVKPKKVWDQVKTTLQDLDPTKIHFVRVPLYLIVIDLDLKNKQGEKDPDRNLKEASKFPPTYAERSKSGAGIHLHYFYNGDPEELSHIYDEDIEIKVYKGKSALRRMLTWCNDFPIATLSSGLPLKERRKTMLPVKQIQSEAKLVELIEKNLRKEIHPATKPSMDFIYKILEDAYASGLEYDVRIMRPKIQNFAMNSTHQADYCLRLLSKMKFCSEEKEELEHDQDLLEENDAPIVFFDVEVFPNLFVVCYKKLGSENPVVRLINPTSKDVEELTRYNLVGFNNRKYDNHILYAKMMGYSEEALYDLSQRIIANDKNALFRTAYNLSYTDIYDFLSAVHKMNLKKWEIKLGIHHQELGLPWDQPVPKELWKKVADYCCNDVIATEAVWNANQADWNARQILADWAEMKVNDTTNMLTTKLIVGNDSHPQDSFVYTDLSTIFSGYEYDPFGIDPKQYKEGTKIVRGKSIYMGEDPGEGGYVYAEPGIWYYVALLDVESMHPRSAMKLKIFGKYTINFENIVGARLFIKHKDYEKAKSLLPERLHHYLNDPKKAKDLSTALKTAINSVYGLTSASFENKLRDPRNKDNIVAKYGALFMITLKHEVQKRGYTVAHIKTDSIKIPNATPEIIQFCMDFAKEYGFTFEHEDTYQKMCLVNDAVYIAKYKEPHLDDDGNEIWWTATGTQFQVPYVFKTLFSHEQITFKDLFEIKSVTTALYLDFNENLGEDEHDYRFVGKTGAFAPMESGVGGAILLRQGNDKFSAPPGTKRADGTPYRWMETEMVEQLGLQNRVDMSYYRSLVDDAVDVISKYGDFENFVNADVKDFMEFMNIPEDVDEELPFD